MKHTTTSLIANKEQEEPGTKIFKRGGIKNQHISLKECKGHKGRNAFRGNQ